MEFRVLGKLEAVRDGAPVDLGSYRQRALIAILLTSPNTVFSTDGIIDGLWGDDVASDRQNALWVYVSGLRKAMEPDREKRSEGTILLTRSPGYLVQASPDEIDAGRFERLLAEGRALTETDPAAASLVLGEALSLWRGRPFEEFTYESFAQPAITRLEGLRLEAVEARIDADLLRGMSRELVSELESLVREHPFQERLTGQLMLALYRSGRQADSLRSYQMLRSRLGEELGIEPSGPIRQLEERIVTGDEDLVEGPRARVPGSGPQPGLAVRGYELRDRLGERGSGVLYRAFQPSVGREVAIKIIRPELADDPSFIRRFEAEAQIVARLEHPHIVPLYDYWREPGAAYLVMRLMKGGSLADVVQRGPLDAGKAARLAVQIGGALQAAHRAGLTHRDVRPGNVLIDDDGNAYLSDFDIAGTDAGDPAADVEGFALVMAQALTGLTGDIGQVALGLAPSVRSVVETARWSGHDVSTFLADLQTALGPAAGDDDARIELDNPYKGLRPFAGADAGDFFGRERLVARLLARLGEPGVASRFVAVVGPSGSGKSSVVRAGLLPAVRAGGLLGDWFVIEMTPAPHPFESLEESLLAVAVDPPPSLLEHLVDGDDGIRRAIHRLLPDDGSRLLLVVDQFEELFTQVDRETSDRFVSALVDAVSDEHGRVAVVATLRADFYDRPLRYRALGELLRDGTEIITPMSPEELDRAVTSPVERHGITFERALVTELVHEVVDRAGALPLLQYTLTELFDGRRTNQITRAAYDELGGVSGALVRRAEGLYAGLGDEARQAARQVFLRLVTLGEGTDDTRRRVLRSELEELTVERRFLDGVLETFGRHRLLSFDRDPVTRGPTVEISHEALLGQWDRLREWIDGARHDVRDQRRLADAMTEWITNNRSDEYLLRGGRLQQLDGWASTTTLPLSEPERGFLDASVAERERAATEERDREQRASDAERREQKRARQVVAISVVASVVAALAVFGVIQWRSAEDSRARAEVARSEADSARVSAEAARDTLNSVLLAESLARASGDRLAEGENEAALALAIQGLRELAGVSGGSEPPLLDAVNFALQAMGVQYDVTPGTPVSVRPGPEGPTGVYALSTRQLVELGDAVSDRRLNEFECRIYYGGECPEPVEVRADQGGYSADEIQAQGGHALAGTTVKLAAASLRAEPGLEKQLADFTAQTGIDVDLVSNTGEALLALESGNLELPDVMAWGGSLPDWARGRALDIGAFIDHGTLTSDFGDYTLNIPVHTEPSALAAPNDVAYGIPFDTDVKGLVFYPETAFAEAGYDVPETWDDLVALSRRIVDDGRSPWCVAFESGFPFNGWPGTDLIESLVLRAAGTDVYDQWTEGRVGFSDPAIAEAARLADSLIFEPGFVRVGPEVISNENFTEQMFNLLRRDTVTGAIEPDCWMFFQGDFMLGALPPGTVVGEDVDYFPMPPLVAGDAVPVVGGVTSMIGLVDRPEVRMFLEYVADPQWGSVWATEPGNGFIPMNQRFDPSVYVSADDDPSANVRQRLFADTRAALAADMFRFDASDMMPPEIGGWTDEPPAQGAFYAGMTDWVDGVRTIDEVLVDIDAAWDELRASGTG